MENPEVLREYSSTIRRLRRHCLDSGISEVEFRQLYTESLNSIDMQKQTETRHSVRKSKRIYKILVVGVILAICGVYSKTIYSNLVCHLQDLIYPGLRLLRHLSIPFISLFPSLTDLYHETCLIHNPFFSVVDMDCWPCSSVNNVREISDPKPVHQQKNAPFVYETEQQIIDFETLKQIYLKNRDIFDKEAAKVLKNNKYFISPFELFEEVQNNNEKSLYTWRFNNMNVARLLRQVIPRPQVVPKFGQSTERFIVLDTSQDVFHIPDTECSYSFLLFLKGSRTIHLVPAEECKQQCKTLKIELRETYLLWYNWWYWRPVVQASTGNNTVIAHIGSYC